MKDGKYRNEKRYLYLKCPNGLNVKKPKKLRIKLKRKYVLLKLFLILIINLEKIC